MPHRLILSLVLLVRIAHAGPFCGGGSGWSPPEGTLPSRPTLVFWEEDDAVYSLRSTKYRAARGAVRLTATLDGKPVTLQIRTVRSRRIVQHFVDVPEAKSGTLVVSASYGNTAPASSTFTIDPEWKRPRPTATTERYHEQASRMYELFYDGLAIVLDAPAISFHVRWRRDARDDWRTIVLPAVVRAGHSAALLGQSNCEREVVPLAWLERGVELDVHATLPDGSTRPVDGLAGTVKLAPAEPPS